LLYWLLAICLFVALFAEYAIHPEKPWELHTILGSALAGVAWIFKPRV
jgi:uncharacterized BrkB/YihY/UPF0761 family membrane protein